MIKRIKKKPFWQNNVTPVNLDTILTFALVFGVGLYLWFVMGR